MNDKLEQIANIIYFELPEIGKENADRLASIIINQLDYLEKISRSCYDLWHNKLSISSQVYEKCPQCGVVNE